MNVIYVDDEQPARDNFKYSVEKFSEIRSLHFFDTGEKAVLWVKEHHVDVAFLDIEMSGLHGIELAKALKEIDRNIRIVFVTAYSQYALEAFQVDAIGYILKPYSRDEIRKELEKAAMMRPLLTKKIVITTIPNFSVRVNGEILRINNVKSRELLALLVDRAGVGVSSAEAISYLWPEREGDEKTQALYRMTLKRLMDTLREAGIEEVVGATGREKYIDCSRVDCDLYRILEGDIDAVPYYVGEYMREYSWAETRNAQLSSIFNSR